MKKTDLYNVRAFNEDVRREIAEAIRYGKPLSLIFADIDFFKKINDEEGHKGGDSALKAVADALKNGIRESDRAYRYGGEEITIILPDTGLDYAIEVAERLRQERESSPVIINNKELKITASFGVATFTPGQSLYIGSEETSDKLTADADTGMYAAKAAGRNKIGYTDSDGKVFVIENPPAISAKAPVPAA